MICQLKNPFVIDVAANPRFGTPTITEVRRAETSNHGYNRVVGGNHGDLLFDGYEVEDGKTILSNPALFTRLVIDEDDVDELAREIFDESFACIGIETVEHS